MGQISFMRRFSLYIAVISLFLFSCSKKDQAPDTPVRGSLSGTIQAWNDKTSSLTDASGILVKISNLNNFSAVTDAAGRYTIDNVPYDIHDVEISKTGYGTLKVFGITHDGTGSNTGTIVPTISFGQLSTTTVTGLSVAGNTINGTPGVSFNYVISPVPGTSNRAFVRYFLSTSPTVSSSEYMAYSIVYNFSNLSNITGFTTNELLGMGFSSGQTVYARMYGDSFRANDYLDPNTGQRVFPNINPAAAAAVSFIVP